MKYTKVHNNLLQSMRALIDDTPKFSSSRDIQRTAQCICELIANQLFQFPTQLDREAIL
jgi:hypothetical protein